MAEERQGFERRVEISRWRRIPRVAAAMLVAARRTVH
jgi:hypothetical protein